MSDTKEGIIVVLSSPSGAGKTTLAKKISFKNNFFISISHTTRKPRLNETNGSDYFFVSKFMSSISLTPCPILWAPLDSASLIE